MKTKKRKYTKRKETLKVKKPSRKEAIEEAYQKGKYDVKYEGIYEQQQYQNSLPQYVEAPEKPYIDPRLDLTIKFMSNVGQTVEAFCRLLNPPIR